MVGVIMMMTVMMAASAAVVDSIRPCGSLGAMHVQVGGIWGMEVIDDRVIFR